MDWRSLSGLRPSAYSVRVASGAEERLSRLRLDWRRKSLILIGDSTFGWKHSGLRTMNESNFAIKDQVRIGLMEGTVDLGQALEHWVEARRMKDCRVPTLRRRREPKQAVYLGDKLCYCGSH